jgi:hypothetical protein
MMRTCFASGSSGRMSTMNRSMLLSWGLVTFMSVLGHKVQADRAFLGSFGQHQLRRARMGMAFVKSVPRGGDSDSFSSDSGVGETSSSSEASESESDEERTYPVTTPEPSSLDAMDGPYAAVSIVVVGKKHKHAASTSATPRDDNGDDKDAIQAGTMLIPTSDISSSSSSLSSILTKAPCWSGRGLWKENTPQLWESLAVLSDVLVVVVQESSLATTSTTIDPTLVQGLRSGLLRRIFQSNLSKGRLLVVVVPSDTTTESAPTTTAQDWASWMDRMVTVDLASVMSETLMETVELVPVARMRQVLADYLLEMSAGDQTNTNINDDDDDDDYKTGRTVDVVDAKAFSAVLQQVYESVGGADNVILLQEQLQDSQRTLIPELRVDHEETLTSTTTTTTAVAPAPITPAPITPVVTEAPAPTLGTAAAVATNTHTDKDDSTPALSLVESVLESAHAQLDDLEAQQEQVWLDDGALPLEFSNKANFILEMLDNALAHVPDSLRERVTHQVGDRLRRLYQQQTQSLRDHFGRMYETALDHSDDADQWSSAAVKVTDRFRKAAQQAVPKLAREGGAFRNMDLEYVGSMQGLVSDMMEATESRQTLEDALAEDESEQIEGGSKPKRPAKWYEKLAARALVLSVNYLQGWLAWQGIKRAAIERDQNMPKFPLF